MNILIVDDEADQRGLLKGFLEKQGYTVTEAESGFQALARFGAEPFQLVLLDHRMPKMTGDELLREIKAINPLVRTIMITAFGSVDTAVSVMKLGADDFIEKPVDLKELLDRIRRIEQQVIMTALEKYQGIQTQAAASLGISERVLRYKMKKHGIQNPGR